MEKKNKNTKKFKSNENEFNWQNFFIFVIFSCGLVLAILLNSHLNKLAENVKTSQNLTMDALVAKAKENQAVIPVKKCEKLRYWAVCLEDWHENPSLRTMDRVFKRMNYEFVNASHGDDWDILWTVETIFQDDHLLFADALKKPFKIHQKINHFEGIGAMVSKTWMNHRNRGEKFVLPSFVLRKSQTGLENLKKFIAENPHKKVLQKNFFNRGVKIVDAKDIVPDPEREIFYQEFMDNPFLIDGHAFDFGVFVLITSFNPVRIYRYDADVLLRFCSEKYHPFDPKIREKYVVAGESKTVYEMPSFKDIYKTYGFPSRIMFENYISERGHDVEAFWKRIEAAIVKITLRTQPEIIKNLNSRNLSSIHFFELVRFDIILDADLNPYVVEVNMSPNITPAGKKYEENILIYEQMVHNVVKMIGGGSYHEFWGRFDSSDILISNKKNLASDIKRCVKFNCTNHCDRTDCAICTPCMTADDRYQMKEAFREHQHGANFKRVFPSPIYFNNETFVRRMTRNNRVSLKWFRGKCEDDEAWC